MLYTILVIAAFIAAFIMSFYTYRRGLKDGLAIQNGAKTIETVKTPVSTFKEFVEHREQRKAQDEFMEAARNIMFYDEDAPKEGE